jgi:hypothetical protein
MVACATIVTAPASSHSSSTVPFRANKEDDSSFSSVNKDIKVDEQQIEVINKLVLTTTSETRTNELSNNLIVTPPNKATPEQAKAIWDAFERLIGTIKGPKDLASQHDHYLYGTPRIDIV